MIPLDTHALLYVATSDTVWIALSAIEFLLASALVPIPINPMINAELAPAFATSEGLYQSLIVHKFSQRGT
jgi:hypothetical protein